MKLNRFKLKFYLSLTALILLTMLISLTLSYFFSYDLQVKQLNSQLRQAVNDKTGHLGEWIESKISLLDLIEKIDFSGFEIPEVPLMNSGITDVYKGFEDGTFESYTGWIPPEGYDPRERPWYKIVKASGQIAFSDPYIDIKTGRMTVSLGWPLYDNEQMVGVIAEDIPIQAIIEKVTKLDFSDFGFVWILNERGIFVYHPNPTVIYRQMNEVDRISGVPAFQSLSDDGQVEYTFNKTDRIAMFCHVPGSQWILGVTVLKDQAFKNLINLRGLYLALSVILSALFGITSIFLTRILAEPLIKIIHFVQAISEGKLDQKLEIHFNKEIDFLGLSLNDMALKLRESFEEIEAQKQALKEYNLHLENQVQVRTKDIEAANAMLQMSYEALEKKATTDYLTGISNRRHFFEEAEREVSRSDREGLAFCVLIADLDDFKLINDRYGHAAGDAVLISTIEQMNECLRDYDLLGRFGGEEFVVLLPETTLQQGMIIGERMCRKVSEAVVCYKQHTLKVTISIGISYRSSSLKPFDKALSEADEVLYQVKNSGKNKIMAYIDFRDES